MDVPRGWLGTSAGVFSLLESDRCCGSYLTVEDAARILKVGDRALANIPTVEYDKKRYVSDKHLGRAWASGEIDSPRRRYQQGTAMISFDELILLALMEMALPNATINPQVRIGRRLVDFQIVLDDKSLIVEFLGPYHFIRRSSEQRVIDPRVRKKQIESDSQVECVIWPYWVQRCVSNVRALFEPSVLGIGSIWSTSAHFGDFASRDAAALITSINTRFNIERPDGVGYMYTDEYVAKPIHPIVRRIREGREPIEKLIPSDSRQSPKYWLPRSLWPLVPA